MSVQREDRKHFTAIAIHIKRLERRMRQENGPHENTCWNVMLECVAPHPIWTFVFVAVVAAVVSIAIP